MKYCGKCGQELDKKTKLCPQCDQDTINHKKKIAKTAKAVVAILCSISIVAVGVFGTLELINKGEYSYTYSEYNSFEEGFTDILVTDENSAKEAIASVGDVLGITNADIELEVVNINKINNDIYYRFQQKYNGIDVYEKVIMLCVNNEGKASALTSCFSPVKTIINLKARAKADKVTLSLQEYLDSEDLVIEDLSEEDLVVYQKENGKHVLAYNFYIDRYGEFIVDADTGRVLCYKNLMNNMSAEVVSKDNSVKTIGWKYDGGIHTLYNDQYKLRVFDFGYLDSDSGGFKPDFTEYGLDTVWSPDKTFEETPVKMLDYTVRISDFYNELGFEGFDRMHIGFNDNYQSGNNARGGGWIIEGKKCGIVAMGKCNNADYFDIICHEYTHAVTGIITSWMSSNNPETGAISEAYSDIFAVLIEGIASPDWYICDSSTCRDLADPSKSTNTCFASVEELKASTYRDSYSISTIISHAAYLMNKGINGNNDMKISGYDLAELWFRALYMMHSGTDLSQCRNAVELSARIMLNNSQITDEQYRTVVTAFEMVGIENSAFTYTKTVNNKFDLLVLSNRETENVHYNLEIIKLPTMKAGPGLINNEMPKLVMEKTAVSGRQMLDLKDGTYVICISDASGSNTSLPIDIKIIVDGDNKNATDEVTIYTDYLEIITVVLNEEPSKTTSNSSTDITELQFEMREEVIEFPLSDGTVYYSNTVKYPYFLGSSDVEKTINNRYAKYIDDFKNNDTDYDEHYESAKQWSDPNPPYYDNIISEVTYNKNGAISIKETAVMWASGGAHPYSTVTGITYDIRSGKELKWQDIIIGSDEAIDKKLKEALEKAVGYSVKGTMMQTLKESTGYSLCDKGLCFYYNVGDAVDRAKVIIEYTDKNSYLIKLADTTSEVSKELTEKDLKAKAEEHGLVSAWGYTDYDGNGKKEAFTIITDEDMSILKTLFISDDGSTRVMEDNLNWNLYQNNEGYIRFSNDKGFFWADMGAYGSGYSTIVYSVKNNSPYILKISSDIQGFYQEGDILYTTKSEFLPEGGHVYPEYELVYDSLSQEFLVGNKIDIE